VDTNVAAHCKGLWKNKQTTLIGCSITLNLPLRHALKEYYLKLSFI